MNGSSGVTKRAFKRYCAITLMAMRRRKLTEAEKLVMLGHGNEMPFTGEYDQTFDRGVYVCRRCGAPLYRSDSKFDAHCGWPAFDKQIRGAVERYRDEDGSGREAIKCAKCGAHIGHVFDHEGFTRTSVRYCANSLSMRFIPSSKKAKSKMRRDKSAEVVYNGQIVEADNQDEKY